MLYALRFSDPAEKNLANLSSPIQSRTLEALRRLSDDPRRAPGVKKLTGESLYRLRVGDFRVIFAVHDETAEVVVLKIGHRRDIYRHR